MERKTNQVFIILSDTGTWFTRIVRLYTKAPYNHASIALDPDLKEVYSFGRKRTENPLLGGFIKEDLQGPLFRSATCAVYRCEVSEKQYSQLKSIISRFSRESHLYKFNIIGLFGVMLNKQIQRKRAFFCSQFIAWLFEQVGYKLLDKNSALTTPADLGEAEALELMFNGKVRSLWSAYEEEQASDDKQDFKTRMIHPQEVSEGLCEDELPLAIEASPMLAAGSCGRTHCS
ncbi:hypothetical protein [Paenibacillus senegalensis]|uniref:hypothetical protein n=1 Tax=Paenibacillus senegalensis TaxID=1465766 RepID=UPI0002898E1B|nr:hypothetical protein [Paenibacillus senegalensis]